jgi:hypothetical protein
MRKSWLWARVDDRIEELAPQLQRDRFLPLPHLRQGVAAELVQAQVERHEDVVLGFEVVVERGLGDVQAFGYLAQAGAVEALLGEEFEGDIEDAVAGGGLGVLGGGVGVGGGVLERVDGLDGLDPRSRFGDGVDQALVLGIRSRCCW